MSHNYLFSGEHWQYLQHFFLQSWIENKCLTLCVYLPHVAMTPTSVCVCVRESAMNDRETHTHVRLQKRRCVRTRKCGVVCVSVMASHPELSLQFTQSSWTSQSDLTTQIPTVRFFNQPPAAAYIIGFNQRDKQTAQYTSRSADSHWQFPHQRKGRK